MAIDDIDRRAVGGPPPAQPLEGWVERLCARVCCVGLVVMMVMTSCEVFSRAVFNYSLQVTDDLGGYILVAITFLSLSVCQVRHAFHRIEFVQARLGPRGRAWSNLIFTLICVGFAALLTWQLASFELASWQSGDVAPTVLAAPLWIPQLFMPLGAAILLFSLLKTARVDLRAALGRLPPRPERGERR
jgi:TRAP-type C4-dicarboxylate transport system permease small subunit